jgi:hypothetical protein
MPIRMKPRALSTLLRYVLWLGVLNTSNANRKHYRMPTTWVAHLTFNSLTLFLPELYRVVARRPKKRGSLDSLLSTADGVMRDVVVNDPRYAIYVAPAAVAVIVAHPRYNIYKGKLGKLRFLGFGLDSIPIPRRRSVSRIWFLRGWAHCGVTAPVMRRGIARQCGRMSTPISSPGCCWSVRARCTRPASI